MTKIETEVETFKRDQLAMRLKQITPSQLELFNRLYPNGVESDDLNSAIDLCDRTIKKNEADPTRMQT